MKVQNRMVLTPVVVEYAARHGLTPEKAQSALMPYQYEVPSSWYTSGSNEEWVFGVQIVRAGMSSCVKFESMDAPSQLKKLEDATRLFTDLGLDPKEAKYYLLAELSW